MPAAWYRRCGDGSTYADSCGKNGEFGERARCLIEMGDAADQISFVVLSSLAFRRA